MGKTYIDTVKYLIYAEVDVDGMVDKPDVVGAIFGQTEGLLGEELDLRDLQKNGRIGRIEVDLRPKAGRTRGTVKIPSSLDMVETCIIGAAIETVERVGPCEANITISNVEDTRSIKREKLIERSKSLLRNLINTEIPESQEISDMVREEVKAAEIGTYGRDKLPSGPGISRAEAVIMVEGRADVVNLLKKDLPNVVAIGGAKVPPTIVELSREKEVTVFLDGDRGGDMILRELVNAGAEMDFVARAPAGKEVEELTRKEVMKCLKNRLPFEQEGNKMAPIPSSRNVVMPEYSHRSEPSKTEPQRDYSQRSEPSRNEPQRDYSQRSEPPRGEREEYRRQQEQRRSGRREPIMERVEREAAKARAPMQREEAPEIVEKIIETKPEVREISQPEPARQERKPEVKVAREREAAPEPVQGKKLSKEELQEELKELSKTLKARFYSEDYVLIKELPVREVIKSLEELKGIHAIVFDGIVTQRLVDLAESKGVQILVGGKMGNVGKKPTTLELLIPSAKK